MILVIDSLNAPHFTGLLHKMYALRARVFRDRLGWEVNVVNDEERDHFDDLHPAHVISLSDDGEVMGCMRLLQTTGPHMLADVFSSILQGEAPLRSPSVWEATRFGVDTKLLTSGRGKNSISYVTSEIMLGAFEYAMRAGVQDAVAVIDPIMDRVLRRSNNAPYDYLGAPTPMGKVTAMAALMDCSENRLAGIREFSGIEGDVFLSEEDAIARYSDAALSPKPELNFGEHSHALEMLRSYCSEQLEGAQDEDDRSAALHLITELEQSLSSSLSTDATTHVKHA